MASGTPVDVGKANRDSKALPAGQDAGRGLNSRQLELNYRWSHYCCAQYDSRKIDWNGKEHLDKVEHEVVARAGMTPPGFVTGGEDLPLKFRRPTVPYYLCRVVTNTFTGLLFSESKHPKVRVLDDPQTEGWLSAFVEATRLWHKMDLGRTFGGAMGSVAVGFKFIKGVPHVEVHDPRWCEVEFVGEGHDLGMFEKRYLYPSETRDRKTGQWVQGDFWYRRVITATTDTVWAKVPAGDDEPDWERCAHRRVEHDLGFVPVVWIKNTEVQDAVDGESDCHGIFDTAEGIDILQSQAHRGTVANCDPTLKLKTAGEVQAGLKKGSNNALEMGVGDDAEYMELDGSGPRLALEVAKTFREQALEVAACVIDTNFDGPARTEAEVSGNYRAMIQQAGRLREQYGTGIKRLLELVLEAARKLDASPSAKAVVKLPPDVQKGENGVVTKVDHEVGVGEVLELKWPPYFDATVGDTLTITQAVSQAKTGGLIDQETAVRKLAPYYDIEEPAEVAEKAKAEMDAESAAMQQSIMSAQGEPQ